MTEQPLTVFLATGNPHKLREIQELLESSSDSQIEVVTVPETQWIEVEETGLTFEANAILKAETFAKRIDGLVLADDSGLEVDALDGAPGIYSARYAGTHCDDEANNQKLLQELSGVAAADRTARYQCVIALADPSGVQVVGHGSVEGLIRELPIGDGGFGYDPLFEYPPMGKTFAEISAKEKHKHSHRREALQDFQTRLNLWLQKTGV